MIASGAAGVSLPRIKAPQDSEVRPECNSTKLSADHMGAQIENEVKVRSKLGFHPAAPAASLRHPKTIVQTLLTPDFFNRDAVIVAQELLGKVISYNGCSGMIVETEAYKNDKASHAHTRTPRSEIMYSTFAHWYIYFIYGMYHCMNVTTNGTQEAGAVLIRALEPLTGIEKMKTRRKNTNLHSLCSGPGKICSALGIGKSLNGTPVNDKISIAHYKRIPKSSIASTPRIGITNGKELEWRFYIKGNEFVSKRFKKDYLSNTPQASQRPVHGG